ncbi:MAG: CpsB/CapC family capsule biosynthesis tyrosine phosphatase [Thermoanaerobaculia bacterium]|nr:CpsB/CapC family capsule biosynthesis tyrosine phosphatase [Thermoanaerobaculia bacterium]
MIDIHCHLLPGIDDGPGTFEEAVALCRAVAAEGCTAALATPHQHHELWWNGEPTRLAELLTQLRAAVGTELDLHAGAEIHVGAGTLDDLDRWPAGELVPLAGSRWVLLEFNRLEPTTDPYALIHELVVAGWRPILAHPEEYAWLAEDPQLLDRLIARGARLQITAANFLGERGRGLAERCRALLAADQVHFLASDAHGTARRPPRLAAAARELARRFGDEVAHRLTTLHPSAILHDRPLPLES